MKLSESEARELRGLVVERDYERIKKLLEIPQDELERTYRVFLVSVCPECPHQIRFHNKDMVCGVCGQNCRDRGEKEAWL